MPVGELIHPFHWQAVVAIVRQPGFRLRTLIATSVVSPLDHLHHLRAHHFEVYAQTLQHASGNAFPFSDESEKQMLRADIGVIELSCLVISELNHLLRARREANIASWRLIPATNHELHS